MGSAENTTSGPFTIRTNRPGDIGMITHRHGVLYNEEFGWGERFEALVARISADFIDQFDPKLDRCWIAERDGKFLGCIMLVKDRTSEQIVAKLRLLLVEPCARGLGVGRSLVRQCTEFARDAEYSRIVLWTQSMLTSARRLYANEGYKRVASKEHESFGVKLVGELWELEL
ncbi:acyl-CoA N-acyltransferase [Penicillium lagena]|uniref:acyl-CoA N-acyltransferase n=1 Tax=Penicillium lagena TaxID=94218 RepID=UPI002540BA60|nr:acyl-CoA N-acyltransferase [Penicillium lagena]KAJ5626193.1 acyl-CoA N-acyltransferase [Penicillium lagena]